MVEAAGSLTPRFVFPDRAQPMGRTGYLLAPMKDTVTLTFLPVIVSAHFMQKSSSIVAGKPL